MGERDGLADVEYHDHRHDDRDDDPCPAPDTEREHHDERPDQVELLLDRQ